MKVLVTGGAGFIGSHIVDRLIVAGHTVHIIDNLSTGKKENINPKATFHHKDILDIDQLDPEYDYINHHAAQMNVRKSVEDPTFDAKTNILGSIEVFKFAEKCKAGIIFASSGGTVYGEPLYFPTEETHETNPISPYGIAKITAEKYLWYFAKSDIFRPAYALRYANVYGPRQNPGSEAGVISIFISKLLKGETPTINGTGRQTRDYVYVDDIAKINEQLCTYSPTIPATVQKMHTAFNVGTGKETSVIQLFISIEKILGTNIDETYGPPKHGELARSCLNSDKLEMAIGIKPTTKLEGGLKNTIEWFKNKDIK